MAIEDTVACRIDELIKEAERLRVGDEHGQVHSEKQAQQCRGWLTAAINVIQIVITDPAAAYRRAAEKIADRDHGYVINEAVGDVSEILVNLLRDAQGGLVASIADHARAEVFDNFLDHAKAYLKDKRKKEAGVVSGVVFEDAVRRVCRKRDIEEADRKLDDLISALVKSGVLSDLKAKRARVAAHVRTKATHAQWDEFDENDVKTTIEFAEEFVLAHLDEA